MPLKIMLYVSLLLPANILLVKRISNIPMTIFSLFVFFSFLWWRSGNKKERHGSLSFIFGCEFYFLFLQSISPRMVNAPLRRRISKPNL